MCASIVLSKTSQYHWKLGCLIDRKFGQAKRKIYFLAKLRIKEVRLAFVESENFWPKMRDCKKPGL